MVLPYLPLLCPRTGQEGRIPALCHAEGCYLRLVLDRSHLSRPQTHEALGAAVSRDPEGFVAP